MKASEVGKHSPGPWRVGEASWTDAGFARYELVGITMLTAADANLIAAAPDLPQALEVLLLGTNKLSPELAGHRAMARAAIDKANGIARERGEGESK